MKCVAEKCFGIWGRKSLKLLFEILTGSAFAQIWVFVDPTKNYGHMVLWMHGKVGALPVKRAAFYEGLPGICIRRHR